MKYIMYIFLLITLAGFSGCENNDEVLVEHDPIPAAPQEVYSVTGDNQVFIYWNGPYESDIVEYVIYRSDEELVGYVEIGSVDAEDNPNLDLIYYHWTDVSAKNDSTYYYAVASVDEAGQISELSAESVYDTPRPEGQTVLYDSNIEPTISGFSFEGETRVGYTSAAVDIYVTRVDSVFYLVAGRDTTNIQDMGYWESFDAVNVAPDGGWFSLLQKFELIEGHIYCVWTADYHFAKIQVVQIQENSVRFDWAYQRVQDNPELSPPGGPNSEIEIKYNVIKKSELLL